MRAEKRKKAKEIGKGAIEWYARLLASYPLIVLAIFLIFTIFAGYHATSMEEAVEGYEDWLPEDIEVVDTFKLVEDQFVGSFITSTIVVETAPRFAKSEEIRDVRDPKVLKYVDLISERAKLVPGVISVESAADVIKDANGGRIPPSLRSVKGLLEKDEGAAQRISNYISDDYTMSLVRLNIITDYDPEELTGELKEAVNIKRPQGISVDITGDPVIDAEMMELSRSTMQQTSFFSFVAVILILIIVFASIKYGIIPLLTIVFGSVWAYGTLVLLGMRITPTTSSVLAMIIGIGIDFGIQVTKRFRYELQLHEREEAMVNTLSNVLYPMCIAAIAAVIGFKCLSLGKLPIMADVGTMMAAGVVFCMVAAITVVPTLLVLFERRR